MSDTAFAMADQRQEHDRLAGVAPNVLRELMAAHPSGVVIVTAIVDGRPVGMTTSSFVSVSLDPPLVLFCAARTSTTWPLMERSNSFVANIVSESSAHVAHRFATSGIDRFEGIRYQRGSLTGMPVLGNCAEAYLECVVHSIVECGDHFLVVARVLAGEAFGGQRPLLFSGRQYCGVRRLVKEA